MSVELDHFFICVDPGAPEAERLIEFGLQEGPRNSHPGQGTANRRFSFRNAMIELLWVENPEEAQSPQTAPTQLWERWSGRHFGVCPFGIIVRPVSDPATPLPFPAMLYQPDWLPPELRIYMASSGLDEPQWFYMPFLKREDREQRFAGHPNGVCDITMLTLCGRTPPQHQSPVLEFEPEDTDHMLIVEFDHAILGEETDFRPELPLILRR